MRPNRYIAAAAFCYLILSSALAMGSSEVLRYPVIAGIDGTMTVSAFRGETRDRLVLPSDAPDGYRFSWRGSFYELVTYPSGRFAVLSLDKHLKGKSLGHTLFLTDRTDAKQPIPEWVTDERPLLTGLPEYSGFLALRYSKEIVFAEKKLTAERILNESIRAYVFSKTSNLSDVDKAAVHAISEDLAAVLAPKSLFKDYWLKMQRRDFAGPARERDLVSIRKVYGLVLVPGNEYTAAIDNIRETLKSGMASAYDCPAIESILRTLESVRPDNTAAP